MKGVARDQELSGAVPGNGNVTTGQIARAAVALFIRSFSRTWLIWLVAVILLTGTNLVDLVYSGPQLTFTPLQIASLTIRVFGTFLITAAVFRTLLDSNNPPWRLDSDFWRYVGLTLILTVVTFGIVIFSLSAARPVVAHLITDQHFARIVMVVIAIAAFFIVSVIFIKLSLWPVAIVIGSREVTLPVAWRWMRGATFAVIGAMLIILPFFVIHFGLTTWAKLLPSAGDLRWQVTIIDGVVSTLQVAVGTAVTAGTYVLLASRAKMKSTPDQPQSRRLPQSKGTP